MIEVITALMAAGGGGGGAAIEPYDIVLTANNTKVINGKTHELVPMDGTAKLAISDYPELVEKTKAFVNQPVKRPPEFVGTDYAAPMVRWGDSDQIVVDFYTKKMYKVGEMLTRWKVVGENFPGGPTIPGSPSGNYGEYPLVSTNQRQTLLTYRMNYDGDESKIFRSSVDGDGNITWVGVMGNPEGADYGLSFNSANLISASGQMPGFIVASMKDAINRNAIVWSNDDGVTWHLIKLHTLVPDEEYIIPHVSFDGGLVILMTGRRMFTMSPQNMTLEGVSPLPWPGYTPGDYYTVAGAAVDWGNKSGFILTQEKLFGWNGEQGIADIRVILDEAYSFNVITQGDGAGAIISGNSGEMAAYYWNGTNQPDPMVDRVRVSEQNININAITFIPPNSPNSPDIVYMSANNQNLTGNHFAMYQVIGLSEGNFILPDAKLGPFAKIVLPPLREPE
jgi:hypothetical protein